jgi:ATP-dependent helicase/nuclease subunit A
MLLEADDFSLAAGLKSPLCGLDDDDLLAIAPDRKGSLWQAVQDAAASSTRLVGAAGRLRRWRRAAAEHGPFGFYASVLEADGGRRAMLARLGPDAADAIDAFLARALAHERDAAPTLADFLAAFEAVSGEIKRDLDQAADEVRVMTVHAAKGLEAPIVILPDTTSLPSASQASRLVEVTGAGGPALVWSPRIETDTGPVSAAKEQRRRADLCEYRRLLYVAMTRAENGLIVCGHAKKSNTQDEEKLIDAGSWYDLVASGLARTDSKVTGRCESVPAFDGDGEIRRWRTARPLDPVVAAEPIPAIVAGPESTWLRRTVRTEPPDPPPLKPSQALDAADRLDRAPEPGAGRVTDAARQRGILAHRLLEALAGISPERRAEEGARIAARFGGVLTQIERATIVADTLLVLAEPALAALFGSGSLAEIPVAGQVRLADGREVAVAGRIDRMAATDGAIVIADFKTAMPPRRLADVPPASVVQLALYRQLLAGICAPRPVSCLVVYTSGPAAFQLPQAMLDAALALVTPP